MDVKDSGGSRPNAGFLRRDVPLVETLLTLGIALLSLCAALAEAARHHWFAELLAHFRVQYVAGLALLSLALVAVQRRASAGLAVAGVFMALAATHVIRASSPRWDSTSVSTRDSLVLMSFNVEGDNDRLADVARTIAVAKPDVVLILEWQAKHGLGLRPILEGAGLKPVVTVPREDNFGIALFSRLPAATSALRYWGGPFAPPSVLAELQVGTRTLRFAGVHPVPPGLDGESERRDALLLDAAREIGALAGPRVLAGDFNLTPWAPTFKNVLNISGLLDSRGKALHTTWPSRFPLYPFFLIPIDHVLVSPDVVVQSRTETSPSGSDHFGVVTTLSL